MAGVRMRAGRLTMPLVGLDRPWQAAGRGYTRGPCPSPGGGPPPLGSVCLVCSASGSDGRRSPNKPPALRRAPGRAKGTAAVRRWC